MTAAIIPIRGGELVKVIEDWLAQARKGEITAIAFAAVMSDDAVCEGWVGDIDSCAVTLYGAINILRDGYFHDRIEHYSDSDCGSKNGK